MQIYVIELGRWISLLRSDLDLVELTLTLSLMEVLGKANFDSLC